MGLECLNTECFYVQICENIDLYDLLRRHVLASRLSVLT